MKPAGLTTQAFALTADAAVRVNFGGRAAQALPGPAAAANDSQPHARRPEPCVTLPARFTVRRRPEHLDVSISTEAVTISAPDVGIATHPLSSYRGISASVCRRKGEPVYLLTLEHEEPAHSIPLGEGSDVSAVAREWQAWAKALGLPLIAVDAQGEVHAELNALGVILAERPFPRRRGSALIGRRSRYARRRRETAPVHEGASAAVHRTEREIIART